MSAPSARISAADRRRQILSVATGLFARQGFQGTKTRQIAERAGVNEALIFRHFHSKEDLYWAILDGKCLEGRGRERLQQQIHKRKSNEDLFAAVAESILRRQTDDSTLFRLLLFSGLENHRLSQRFFRTYVAGYHEVLADHIRAQIRAGRFRAVNPLLAARGFLGMVFNYFLTQEIFGAKRYHKFDLKRVSRTLADIWLGGMLKNHQRNHKPLGARPTGNCSQRKQE
jgi:AcrR family transcriptional regulator